MVSGEYPPMKGGVSRYTYSLVKALAKKVEVCVATNEDVSNIPEEHDDHTDYDSNNNNGIIGVGVTLMRRCIKI